MNWILSDGKSERRYSGVLLVCIALIIVLVLALWGGTPQTVSDVGFYAGLAIFATITLVFGVAGWHLLIRPLPDGHTIPPADILSPGQRRGVALAQTLAGLLLTTGGMWDEFWHRTYGLPFGEDFFWRPHLLMYTGFGISLGLGLWGWYRIAMQERGTLQQRFRQDRAFGLVVLVGTFMAYALPADPVWHELYGNDISAWSLPHVILVVLYAAIVLTAVVMQLSMVPDRPWRTLNGISSSDFVPLLSYVVMHAAVILLLMTDWDVITQRYDSITALQQAAETRYMPVLERPDWLLPAFTAFLSGLIGMIASSSLKLIGVATLAGVLSTGFRLLMISLIQPEAAGAGGWYITLLPLMMLDAWQFVIWMRYRQMPVWWTHALAVTAGVLLTLPFLNSFFLYPRVTLDALPGMLLFSFVGALMGVWMGSLIGRYIATSGSATTQTDRVITWRTPAAFAGAVLFMIWFMMTASPPV